MINTVISSQREGRMRPSATAFGNAVGGYSNQSGNRQGGSGNAQKQPKKGVGSYRNGGKKKGNGGGQRRYGNFVADIPSLSPEDLSSLLSEKRQANFNLATTLADLAAQQATLKAKKSSGLRNIQIGKKRAFVNLGDTSGDSAFGDSPAVFGAGTAKIASETAAAKADLESTIAADMGALEMLRANAKNLHAQLLADIERRKNLARNYNRLLLGQVGA